MGKRTAIEIQDSHIQAQLEWWRLRGDEGNEKAKGCDTNPPVKRRWVTHSYFSNTYVRQMGENEFEQAVHSEQEQREKRGRGIAWE